MPWTQQSEPSDTWDSESNPDFSDSDAWRLPDDNEHMLATIAITELRINIDEMTELPEDIQAGREAWTVEG